MVTARLAWLWLRRWGAWTLAGILALALWLTLRRRQESPAADALDRLRLAQRRAQHEADVLRIRRDRERADAARARLEAESRIEREEKERATRYAADAEGTSRWLEDYTDEQ